MKYMRRARLIGAVTVVLCGFGGVESASATQLESATGVMGVGSSITGDAMLGSTLHPAIGEIKCTLSLLGGKLSKAGGSSETVAATVEEFTFSGCEATVKVLGKGTLEFHTQGSTSNNNGTLTSTGAQVTVEHLGFHCIFSTFVTDLGTVTGSWAGEEFNAFFDVNATIPRTGGTSGAFCGSTMKWTAKYKITTPFTLYVT